MLQRGANDAAVAVSGAALLGAGRRSYSELTGNGLVISNARPSTLFLLPGPPAACTRPLCPLAVLFLLPSLIPTGPSHSGLLWKPSRSHCFHKILASNFTVLTQLRGLHHSSSYLRRNNSLLLRLNKAKFVDAACTANLAPNNPECFAS